MFQHLMKIKNRLLMTATTLLLSTNVFAAGYDIGTGGDSSTFGKITKILQSWVDFMTGPYSKAAIAGTAIIVIIIWAIAPKEGILGHGIRIVVAGVACLNIAAWMGLFGG